MKNKSYLLVLYLTELHIWFKLGVKKVEKNRLISTTIKNKKVDKIIDKILDTALDFEDDFEVVVAEIPYKDIDKSSKVGKFIYLRFEWILNIYPITSRGKILLQGKLDYRIKLNEPIFEDSFLKLSKLKEKELSKRGAEVLLKTFNLEKYSEKFASISEFVLVGLNLRYDFQAEISPSNHFITNLILYDRRKPFPNNDLGFFYDIGAIIKLYHNNNDDNKKILQNFADYLDRIKINIDYLRIDNIISNLDNWEIIKKLENIIKENIIVASVIFLYLRHKIRETDDIEKSGIYEIYSNKYLKLQYEEQIALAFWLTGFFFGFDKFADLYYVNIKPNVLDFSKTNSKPINTLTNDSSNKVVNSGKGDLEDHLELENNNLLNANDGAKSLSSKKVKEKNNSDFET